MQVELSRTAADLRDQLETAPPGLVKHEHTRRFVIRQPRPEVWSWLNDPATFVDGQVWPYRVEFLGGGFEEGVACNHHGPFLSLPGVLRGIRAPESRELVYLYGAYVLTPRFIRPTRLRFDLREVGDGAGTEVTLRLESWVRPWVRGFWSVLQGVFWVAFIATAARSVRRHARRARAALAGS